MPRVKRGFTKHRRRLGVLGIVKGQRTSRGHLYRTGCGNPVERQFVIGIGVSRARFAGSRRFTRINVSVPRGIADAREFGGKRIETGIVKLREEAPLEFGLVKLRRRHALAWLGRLTCLEPIEHLLLE